MSYKITARVFQKNPNNFFELVEKAVLVGGTWSVINDEHVLNMISSGTSGMLRFAADNGEVFTVALGVHNYVRWCDVITNLTRDCCITLLPEYYNAGPRAPQREKQLASYAVHNTQGRTIEVNFTKADGNDLRCNIIIG